MAGEGSVGGGSIGAPIGRPVWEPEIDPAGDAAPAPSTPLCPAPEAASLSERDAWTVLLSVQGLGPVTFEMLLDTFGSALAVLDVASAEGGAGRLVEAVTEAARRAIDAGSDTRFELSPALAGRIADATLAAERKLEALRTAGIEVVTLEDPEYPPRLRLVEMPPPVLFVTGHRAALDRPHMVAVVGTRRATDRGRMVAAWIGAALSNAGAAVVSGLAVGIDGAAHAATLAEGGVTIAVLGGGHRNLFPRAHARLADAIAASGGAVISEYEPDTMPSRGTFPRRNRLVSGMSDATIVVEAGRRSGALITAGWALGQGRECFIVPGPLGEPASAGCLDFLRAFPGQARIVAGIPELIEDLGLAGSGSVDASEGGTGTTNANGTSGRAPVALDAILATLSPLERGIAERLSRGPATADELAVHTAGSPASVLSALTLLELRGLVTSGYGRYLPAGSLLRAGPAEASAHRPLRAGPRAETATHRPLRPGPRPDWG